MIFHDHNGKLSMMRVGFMVTLAVGAVLCMAGIVAVFMSLPASEMITAGAGLMGSSGWAKAVQTKWEGKHGQ